MKHYQRKAKRLNVFEKPEKTTLYLLIISPFNPYYAVCLPLAPVISRQMNVIKPVMYEIVSTCIPFPVLVLGDV